MTISRKKPILTELGEQFAKAVSSLPKGAKEKDGKITVPHRGRPSNWEKEQGVGRGRSGITRLAGDFHGLPQKKIVKGMDPMGGGNIDMSMQPNRKPDAKTDLIKKPKLKLTSFGKTVADACCGYMKKEKEKMISAPASEMVDEHKRVVQVLESPSHEDDKQEVKIQRKELKEYKAELGKANDPTDAHVAARISHMEALKPHEHLHGHSQNELYEMELPKLRALRDKHAPMTETHTRVGDSKGQGYHTKQYTIAHTGEKHINKSMGDSWLCDLGDKVKKIAELNKVAYTFEKKPVGSTDEYTFKVGDCRIVYKTMGTEAKVSFSQGKEADFRNVAIAKTLYYSIKRFHTGEAVLAKSEIEEDVLHPHEVKTKYASGMMADKHKATVAEAEKQGKKVKVHVQHFPFGSYVRHMEVHHEDAKKSFHPQNSKTDKEIKDMVSHAAEKEKNPSKFWTKEQTKGMKNLAARTGYTQSRTQKSELEKTTEGLSRVLHAYIEHHKGSHGEHTPANVGDFHGGGDFGGYSHSDIKARMDKHPKLKPVSGGRYIIRKQELTPLGEEFVKAVLAKAPYTYGQQTAGTTPKTAPNAMAQQKQRARQSIRRKYSGRKSTIVDIKASGMARGHFARSENLTAFGHEFVKAMGKTPPAVKPKAPKVPSPKVASPRVGK